MSLVDRFNKFPRTQIWDGENFADIVNGSLKVNIPELTFQGDDLNINISDASFNNKRLITYEFEYRESLELILLELQKLNMHLSLITEHEIKESDIR